MREPTRAPKTEFNPLYIEDTNEVSQHTRTSCDVCHSLARNITKNANPTTLIAYLLGNVRDIVAAVVVLLPLALCCLRGSEICCSPARLGEETIDTEGA